VTANRREISIGRRASSRAAPTRVKESPSYSLATVYWEGPATSIGELGTPWQGFYEPVRILALARSLRFTLVRAISPDELNDRCCADRRDDLRAPQAHHFVHAGLG
jgi:hypothetical protein